MPIHGLDLQIGPYLPTSIGALVNCCGKGVATSPEPKTFVSCEDGSLMCTPCGEILLTHQVGVILPALSYELFMRMAIR